MILDGLINFVSRIGTAADKRSASTYTVQVPSQSEIDAAFRTTWYRKIVTIPAEDAIREGVTWQADDDAIELIEAECNRLKLWSHVFRLLVLARKDGSAYLYMGGLPGDPRTPFTGKIGANGLSYLLVFDRYQLVPMERDTDPLSPTFNEPKMYSVNGASIHPSRIIRRIGNDRFSSLNWDGHGDSMWQVVSNAVKNFDTIADATAALSHEAKKDIIKIKNFMSQIPTREYEEALMKRFTAVASLGSVINATVIDSDDDWQQKNLSFTGLPEISDRAAAYLSGMADIPQTRLFGRSPAGMNSTGDSDMKNYYAQVQSRQKIDLTPCIHPLIECVIQSALGLRPPEIYYEWNPLDTPTEKEAAEIEKLYADALTARVNTALFNDEVLAKAELNRMTESGQYPGIEAAIAEAGDDGVADPTEVDAAEMEADLTAADGNSRPALAANDAQPRTLYVRRDVVNKSEITAWAKSQGMTDIVPDLHVTIVYSRTAIDWIKAGNDSEWSGGKQDQLVIPQGGPRAVEPLGNMAAVLMFASSRLSWRHEDILRAGASSDYPDYQPHVSLTKTPMDLSKVEPYRGAIVLGPEIFEELKADA